MTEEWEKEDGVVGTSSPPLPPLVSSPEEALPLSEDEQQPSRTPSSVGQQFPMRPKLPQAAFDAQDELSAAEVRERPSACPRPATTEKMSTEERGERRGATANEARWAWVEKWQAGSTSTRRAESFFLRWTVVWVTFFGSIVVTGAYEAFYY